MEGIEALKSEQDDLDGDYFEWSYRGQVYKLNYFGVCSHKRLVEIMSKSLSDGGVPADETGLVLMSDFFFYLFNERYSMPRGQTDTMANVRTFREVMQKWLGN